jgi:hypothetical protein
VYENHISMHISKHNRMKEGNGKNFLAPARTKRIQLEGKNHLLCVSLTGSLAEISHRDENFVIISYFN